MPNQQITGLSSGMDTANIVQQLMAIEKSSVTKLESKVKIEELKLQAYQAVNNMFLEFRTKINTLSNTSTWLAKKAASSKDNILAATASQYATAGTYTFRVAQLASTAQYMTRGFSGSKDPILKNSEAEKGYITLESAKARVDISAKLETLNGGRGVYRGAIQITDKTGGTATIDLSACETVDDVVRTINSTPGVRVQARLAKNADGSDNGDRLELVDNTGGTGNLTVLNVGTGTTATDLGIAGTAAGSNTTIAGRQVYYIGNETNLKMLNDGLGIETGVINIASGNAEVDVDLSTCSTVGDILTAVNTAVKNYTGADQDKLQNLRIQINSTKNGFEFVGGVDGSAYTVTNVWKEDDLRHPMTTQSMGFNGVFLAQSGKSFGGSVLLGEMNSPMIKNLSGATASGVGNSANLPVVPANSIDYNTLLKNLNNGSGIDVSTGLVFRIDEGGSGNKVSYDIFDRDTLTALATNKTSTVNDLLAYLNTTMENSGVAALKNIKFDLDAGNPTGLAIYGVSKADGFEVANSLATSLGVTLFEGLGNAIPVQDPTLSDTLYTVKSIAPTSGDLTVSEARVVTDLTNAATNTQITNTDLLDAIFEPGYTVDAGTGAVTGTARTDAMVIKIGDPSTTGLEVSIDFSSLTETAKLSDIQKLVNDQIAAAVSAKGWKSYAAPQMIVDWGSQGLNWRNVNKYEDFSVTGGLSDMLGADRSFTAIDGTPGGGNFANLNGFPGLNPVQTGYYTPLTATTKIGELNAGAGLNFNDSLVMTFLGSTPSAINISGTDLKAALQAVAGGGNVNDLTVTQYVDTLNNMIADVMSANPAAIAYYGDTKIKFGLMGNGIDLAEIELDPAATVGDTLGGINGLMIESGAASSRPGADFGIGNTVLNPNNYDPTSSTPVDIRPGMASPTGIAGLGVINLNITTGGTTTPLTLNTSDLGQNSTLSDLMGYLNKQLTDAGHSDMRFVVNSAGNGLAFENSSGSTVEFLSDPLNSLAADLGFAGKKSESLSYVNGGNLDRKYVARSTSLSTLNGGKNMDGGQLSVTNAQGMQFTIDMSFAKTVGDVLDALNEAVYGVEAYINETGDGIVIRQSDPYQFGSSSALATGGIKITDLNGGSMAKQLGLGGASTGNADGRAVLDGSFEKQIEIGKEDSLESIMYSISDTGAYTTSIVNDGSGYSPYRLVVTAKNSGAGSDFIMDSNLDIFGLHQTVRGQDALLLYGQQNSGAAPVLLASSTNTNNQAISGLTIDMKSASTEYVTLSVSEDKEAATEAIKGMVESYNNMADLIAYLDDINPETGEPGVLFGDISLRNLMNSVNEMFYGVYNPNGLNWSEITSSSNQTSHTWFDFGVSFNVSNSKTDNSGRWISRMDLNLDTLNDWVSTKWDVLRDMLCSTRDAANSTLSSGSKATASFNFKNMAGNQFDPNDAINGNKVSSGWGNSNGFEASDTIANGENAYTITFPKATTLSRLTINHPNSPSMPANEWALRDFTVEYLDATTGRWETLREVTKNQAGANYIGFEQPTSVSALRITAKSTNAKDGKFRLLEVEAFEDTGLAGQLNRTVNSYADSQTGFMATRKGEVDSAISSLKSDIDKMNERLASKEESLTRQFTAMEMALGKMQSQSNYLTNTFSSMSKSK